MHLDRYLYAVSVLLTFSIRVAVVWLFCLIFSHLLRRPNQRFILWLLFSLGTAAYWIGALSSLIFLPTQSQTISHEGIGHFAVSANWQPVFAALSWLLGATYIVGLAILLTSRLVNGHRLRRLLQFGSRPSPEFAAALDAIQRELKVKRCKLVVLPEIASPATVYWLNPLIVYPQACHQPERLAEFMHIMRHELAHIVRRDYLVSSVIDGVCALLFFHPAVWAARKRLRIERELACDRAVVESCPEERADYAASLAQFVRMGLMARSPNTDVQFAAPASLLGRRIRTILLEPVAGPAWNRLCSAGLVVTMIMTIGLFAPQLSFSFSVMQTTVQGQLASTRVLTMAPRMRRHNRLDFAQSEAAETVFASSAR